MNNEKKEQRAGSKEQSEDCSKIASLTLLIALCSLLIVSCDLFNGPVQPDFQDKLDKEIRWSNAAKLTVRVEYPGAWGTSSPSAGQVSPSAMDIRQGYAFELGFFPDTDYNFKGWRAYETAVLNGLGGDWRTDLSLLEKMVDGELVILVAQLSGVEIPVVPARGGKGEFVINTVTPVTLVPWCRAEPYVIRTDPRSEDPSSTDPSGYPPTTPIAVYFNTALSSDMIWSFGDSIVDIKARPFDSIPDGDFTIPYNDRFDRIEYESKGGQNMLTIYPSSSNPPDVNHQIEVTLGPSIKNSKADLMSSPEVIYYKVSEQRVSDARITGWTATYNNAGAISVSFTLNEEASSAGVTAYYQMNQGGNQPIELLLTGTTRNGTIGGVSAVDSGGIREGRQVGSIQEYRVTMELTEGGALADRVEFKIWNFPGMSVNSSAPAIEIFTAADLANIQNTGLGRQYVLANDIIVPTHTPIGTGSGANAFTGKFYGNGKTITICGFNNNTYTGLFGYISGSAIIRDLSVAYDSGTGNRTVTIPSNNVIRLFGGVAGWAEQNTTICNIITGGSLNVADLTISNNDKYIGGITGTFPNTVTMTNIRAGLNLSAKASTNPGSVYFGGITGDTAYNGTSSRVAMSGVSVTGNLTHEQSNGAMYAGGVAGWFRASVSVSDIEFSGTLTVIKTGAGNTNAGGIFGYAGAGLFSNCRMSGSIEIPGTHNSGGAVYVGGLLGSNLANLAGLTFNSSYATGNINCNKTGNGDLNCGGLIGLANALRLTDCWYEQGAITVGASTGPLNLGGVAGNVDGPVFTNCRSLARSASAESTQDIRIGGFLGCFLNGQFINCYAQTDISAKGGASVYAGGFAGSLMPTSGSGITLTISKCYATGNVEAIATGEISSAGGFIGEMNPQNATGNCEVFIENIYSLGNANATGDGRALAGGLMGQASLGGQLVGNFKISNCFSGGNASAISRRTINDINASTSAGGIVSRMDIGSSVNCIFQNNVALGNSVKVASTQIRGIGRVYGLIYGSSTWNRNYAKESMRVEQSNNFNANYFPYWNGTGTAPASYYTLPNSNSASDPHGMNASASAFYSVNFWRTTLGFDPDVWDFNTVVGRGYPTLVNVGGQ
jgi:hypothetical protein